MSRQQGFIFPYVLFVVALALLFLAANVKSYQDEIRIAHNQSEQLKIDSLIQMSRTQFTEEITDLSDSEGEKSYEWPYGTVQIKYVKLNDDKYQLQFTVTTDEGAGHSVRNRLTMASE